MATKSFKIGECAIGGIIKVDIKGKLILIKALDYYSKKEVSTGSGMTDDYNGESKVLRYLEDLTTPFYAEKVMKWIKSKVEFKIVY